MAVPLAVGDHCRSDLVGRVRRGYMGHGVMSEVEGQGVPLHEPVMRDRIVALLAPALQTPGSVLVDATRRPWRSQQRALGVHARMLGWWVSTAIASALEIARHQLAEYSERATFIHTIYDELAPELARLGYRTGPRGAVRPRGLIDAAG